MGFLSEILAPATPATFATFRPFQPQESQESQESQPVRPENVPTSDRERRLLVTDREHATPPKNHEAEKSAAGRVLFTNYGAGYRHPDGRVETGAPEPTPRPTEAWPADLNGMLRRVATAFEWTRQDVADFVAWARRSPEALADAQAFLRYEARRLP